MKSVGIITVHRLPNWGSLMQAYALQKIIESLGYNCECIDYIYPNDWHIKRGSWKPYKISLKTRIAEYLKLRPRTLHELANDFVRDEIKVSSRYISFESLHQRPPQYDIYVSGSDQIWNWKTMCGDTSYMLDFVPHNKLKISYSSSFSINYIPDDLKEIYIEHLSRYSHISVREMNGQQLIKDLLNRNAKIVLDPTLLIKKEQWQKLSNKSRWEKKLPNKYILCYTLGYTYNPHQAMAKLLTLYQEKMGYPIIFIGKPVREFKGKKFIMHRSQGIGVYEFLYLIEHASICITSSFHGTAFSVNMGIPFISMIERMNQDDDRIQSFLSSLGLENHLVTINSDFKNISIDATFDYNAVNQRLDIQRNESIKYLSHSLTTSI